MTLLSGDTVLLLPGLSLFGVSYFLLQPLREPLTPIGVFILVFIFLRDAMTPAGYGAFGLTEGDVPLPWMRTTSDPVALLAAAPTLRLSTGAPLGQRGGDMAVSTLPTLAPMYLAGNPAEEVTFRGCLQGHLEQHLSGLRAALLAHGGAIFLLTSGLF